MADICDELAEFEQFLGKFDAAPVVDKPQDRHDEPVVLIAAAAPKLYMHAKPCAEPVQGFTGSGDEPVMPPRPRLLAPADSSEPPS